MKNFLLTTIASATAVLSGTAAIAGITIAPKPYNIAAGETMQRPFPVMIEGTYTLSVSSDEGDVDIYMYDAEGTRIGESERIGTDSLTGTLTEGDYTIDIHMASCSNPSGSCAVNFVIEISDDAFTTTD
ncbi:MAG: hypothetical protein AAFU53_14580 [Cyanobacteria bacterium J06632_3]